MSIAFSHSTRALHNDRIVPTIVLLVVVAVLLSVWALWFTLARISIYESSTQLQVNRDRSITATFEESALSRLRAGQPATFTIQRGAKQKPEELRAVVSSVDTRSKEGQGRVNLYVYSSERLAEPVDGKVSIEVEKTSPAELSFKAIGQRLSQIYTSDVAKGTESNRP